MVGPDEGDRGGYALPLILSTLMLETVRVENEDGTDTTGGYASPLIVLRDKLETVSIGY
jgi:hypothetical protein